MGVCTSTSKPSVGVGVEGGVDSVSAKNPNPLNLELTGVTAAAEAEGGGRCERCAGWYLPRGESGDKGEVGVGLGLEGRVEEGVGVVGEDVDVEDGVEDGVEGRDVDGEGVGEGSIRGVVS